MNNCPYCNVSLIGEPIPEKDQEFFGTTHFRREIGWEYPALYDGIWEYECPDCHKRWPSVVARLKKQFKKIFFQFGRGLAGKAVVTVCTQKPKNE